MIYIKNQEITITLEEYKQLRDLIEDYHKLMGEYKFLYHLYQELTKEEIIEETKEPIGFTK